MQVLDRILVTQNTTLSMFVITSILTLSLFIIIMLFRMFVMNKMKNWLKNKLSKTVFLKQTNFSLESKTIANSKQLRDLQTIQIVTSRYGLISIMDTPWAIIIIILLFILHASIGFLVVTAGAALIALNVIIDRSTKPLMANNNDNFIKSMRQVDQSIQNGEVIEEILMKKDITSFWIYKNQKISKTQNIVAIFFKLFIAILAKIFGVFLVIQGQITTGTMSAIFPLVLQTH
ncbi:MAG: ABC-type protease/lipase transport system fused ATPase/permease subunit [Candidatus Midichloriaceae bacterium]|jgi:ABC-type protease/lipase transport system fused ATPase/permease subunit